VSLSNTPGRPLRYRASRVATVAHAFGPCRASRLGRFTDAGLLKRCLLAAQPGPALWPSTSASGYVAGWLHATWRAICSAQRLVPSSVMARKVRGWVHAMLAASPERDEAEAQKYWRVRFTEHPEDVRQDARSGGTPSDKPRSGPDQGSSPHERRTMPEAVGILVLSVLLYIPGACLLGYGLGPGSSTLLIVVGALMIVAGLPLRILAQRWRRGVSTRSPGSTASLKGD
jgi:hypothetical protein